MPEKLLKYNLAITKRFVVSNEKREASPLRPLDDQLKVQVCLAELIAVMEASQTPILVLEYRILQQACKLCLL